MSSRKATGWSAESLITSLRKAADKLGHSPTIQEYKDLPGPSDNAVTRQFGTWNKALLLAGLPLRDISKTDISVPEEHKHFNKKAAYIAGYQAALKGADKSDCPHSNNRGGRLESWKRGWEEGHSYRNQCAEVELR